jgi:hypothetical protein
MPENEMGVVCEALKLVPAQWRADFVKFVEDGEGSDKFLAFLEENADCRRACEQVLRADRAVLPILDLAMEPRRADEACRNAEEEADDFAVIGPGYRQPIIPHDKIAMRAYENWVKKGRPQGTCVRDWNEAEAQLKSEAAQAEAPEIEHKELSFSSNRRCN